MASDSLSKISLKISMNQKGGGELKTNIFINHHTDGTALKSAVGKSLCYAALIERLPIWKKGTKSVQFSQTFWLPGIRMQDLSQPRNWIADLYWLAVAFGGCQNIAISHHPQCINIQPMNYRRKKPKQVE